MGKLENNLTKYIAIGIIITVIASISFAVNIFNKPSSLIVTDEADYKLNADQLFAEFTKNEKKANKKYLDKVIAVAGEVTIISSLDSLNRMITLKSNNKFGVRCQLPESVDISGISVGDIITIKGLCTGILMDVVLVKCTIENEI